MTKRSYDTMAEANVESDAEAAMNDNDNNDDNNDDDDDEEEEEDDLQDGGADESNSADDEEEAAGNNTDEGDDGDDDDRNSRESARSAESDNEDLDSEADSSDDDDIPTPEQVEVEYTYPDDFQDREWADVVEAGHYFRVLIDGKTATMTEIPDKKFKRCKWLIELVFLNNTTEDINNRTKKNEQYLRRIGKDAFMHCRNLQRITNGFPLGLVELDEFAFYNCVSLRQEMTFPRKVRVVGTGCFIGCHGITRVVFDHLPTDPVTIQYAAFSSCTGLRSAMLPPNLPSIPQEGFCGCVALIHIPIPHYVREIKDDTFRGCTSLRSIQLSENMERIHLAAYMGCTSLETVTINSSTVQFERNCFEGCPVLTTIKLYPWVVPRLLGAMNNNFDDDDEIDDNEEIFGDNQRLKITEMSFCYNLVRQSQYQLARFRQQS